MPVAIEAEVRKALGPFHAALREIIEDAWLEMRSVIAWRSEQGMPLIIYDRTKSNYMFDAIAARFYRTLAREDGINVQVESQTFKFFARGVAVRIKKGGDDELGCSIPTQAALAFEDAEQILPGFPPGTAKVEVIWLPDATWTQIASVRVVARDGDRLLWSYEIESGAAEAPLPIPIRPLLPPDDGGIGELLKPKKAAGKKAEK